MKHSIIVAETMLFYDAPLVVAARDASGRNFVGVAYGPDTNDDTSQFVFVQVDRVTLTELERGILDLRTLMTARCAGALVVARAYGAPDEVVVGVLVASAPAESLPKPGMFMPTDLQLAA